MGRTARCLRRMRSSACPSFGQRIKISQRIDSVSGLRRERPTAITAIVVRSFLCRRSALSAEARTPSPTRGPDAGVSGRSSFSIYEFFTTERRIPSRIFTHGCWTRASLDIRGGRVNKHSCILMKLFSVLFWSLVVVTTLVSYRWGSMVGLIFFIAPLMTGALVASQMRIGFLMRRRLIPSRMLVRSRPDSVSTGQYGDCA